MMTFSINIGTNIEAYNYNIIGATSVDISEVLDSLRDNIDKEIFPKKLRDSILTSYSSSGFKETIASMSSISYIGVDTFNPDSNDSKYKIFLGKRSYNGTYSYNYQNDIMNSTLLNSDADILLFNTKSDTISNNRTRISILSGTDSTLHSSSPYIQSQVITLSTQSSLDIVNQTLISGTQNSLSIYSGSGTVSINNIQLPSSQESYGYVVGLTGAADNRVFKYESGKLVWGDIAFNSESVGDTASELNIYGYPVNLNNYSIEFTDERECPIEIGDIKLGEKFNSYAISEMLRRIVYPYIPPACSINILSPYSSGYVEVGTSPIVELNYTISKKSENTGVASLSNMSPSSHGPITTPNYSSVSGTASGIVILPIQSTTYSFKVSVSDGVTTSSASTTLSGVYPYFYGFSSLTSISTPTDLVGLNKLIEPLGDKSLDITGTGNLFFIYNSDYPELSNIYDQIGNTISSSFTHSLVTLSSPTGLWASEKFRVYKRDDIGQIGPPSVIYEFKY